MTISILALKGKLNGKILLLRFFFVGYIYTCSMTFCFPSSTRCNLLISFYSFFNSNLLKTSFASVINVHIFTRWKTWKLISFYCLTKTWKYGDIVFGTKVAGGAQTE